MMNTSTSFSTVLAAVAFAFSNPAQAENSNLGVHEFPASSQNTKNEYALKVPQGSNPEQVVQSIVTNRFVQELTGRKAIDGTLLLEKTDAFGVTLRNHILSLSASSPDPRATVTVGTNREALLEDVVQNLLRTSTLTQGKGTCGISAVTEVLNLRQPADFVRHVRNLWEHGETIIGGKSVSLVLPVAEALHLNSDVQSLSQRLMQVVGAAHTGVKNEAGPSTPSIESLQEALSGKAVTNLMFYSARTLSQMKACPEAQKIEGIQEIRKRAGLQALPQAEALKRWGEIVEHIKQNVASPEHLLATLKPKVPCVLFINIDMHPLYVEVDSAQARQLAGTGRHAIVLEDVAEFSGQNLFLIKDSTFNLIEPFVTPGLSEKLRSQGLLLLPKEHEKGNIGDYVVSAEALGEMLSNAFVTGGSIGAQEFSVAEAIARR